nr:hydantoinase B/oxoprolinase family protein [Actinomycetes bacterium]
MTTVNTAPGWEFWIDRGGTFTDVVGHDPAGELHVRKLLSHSPAQYRDAAIAGIRSILEIPNGPLTNANISSVKMGTTVATNALLERQGDRTLFVTTRGFADSLRIGYQNRPRLFDLHIQRPEPLYEQVLEVDERVTADGIVLSQVQPDLLRAPLLTMLDQGIRSIAVAFMHAYRFPAHEQAVAALARELGFTQVTTSHETSSLIKFVGRADTAVVDAYLAPILARYVSQVADELGDVNLQFMQSSGGLTDASTFRARNAILSGPAGGIVGASRVSEALGASKLITFDMGGTSTDVAHYNNTLERTFDTEIAGVRMRAPMLAITTVAAGGGSICSFDGTRYRVGPASAGADPGPLAYGRGGPLTITDCNVMLGRLQPEFFPAVFGPGGHAPLQSDAVSGAFAAFADEIQAATGVQRSPAAVAEGFLEIAVTSMANAIKSISVQKGHDLADYALSCFGGAGGQHACAVADVLGIETVLIHPLAGVLSAYGMGLADKSAISEGSIEQSLQAFTLLDLQEQFLTHDSRTKTDLLRQGTPESAITMSRLVRLKYAGTDTALPVQLADPVQMHSAFENQHRARFGYVQNETDVVIDSIVAEARFRPSEARPVRSSTTDTGPQAAAPTDAPAAPVRTVTAHVNGEAVETPVFQRDMLCVGQQIPGPAIVTDPMATTYVELGWAAHCEPDQTLRLIRAQPRSQTQAIGTSVDPARLELFNSLFMSIAEQMGFALQNTAQSVNIKERLDFSCAIFDAHGGLVANAPHIPVHLGSMSETVRQLISERGADMQPGDVFASNAPYRGGTHLPDITVITPVFAGPADHQRIIFYVGSRGHHADIGGITPGSMPPHSRTLTEEGVVIDNLRIVQAGALDEDGIRDVLGSAEYPSRNPDRNLSDLAAQVAANQRGVFELGQLVDTYGQPTVAAYMQHVQDNAEEHVRRVLANLASGEFTTTLDNGATIAVRISVDQVERTAIVDFTGSSDQLTNNFNAPQAIARAAVLYVFRCLVQDDIPLNDGCLIPVQIILP